MLNGRQEHASGALEAEFASDPFGYLRAHAGTALLATGAAEWSVGDPLIARHVLLNTEDRYLEHSDFFTVRGGLYGTPAQRAGIRRELHALLQRNQDLSSPLALGRILGSVLGSVSIWPDAGNLLIHRVLGPLLLAPGRDGNLEAILADVVVGSVCKSATRVPPWWGARRLREFRLLWLLSVAIERRRRSPRALPLDFLDVMLGCSPSQSALQIAQVYLAGLFSIAGSMGFVLGWAVYCSERYGAWSANPEWVARETIRLWPVAWRLARRPARSHLLGGREVDPTQKVVVCPYLIQRHPAYWEDADAFRPSRWSDPAQLKNPAFLAFGYGPRRCIAADFLVPVIANVLAALTDKHTISIEVTDSAIRPEAVLASPLFELTRTANGTA